MMEKHKQSKGSPLGEALQAEVARRSFVRAAMLAEKLQRPQAEVRHLQELALKQMACEYRNAIGTRKLAHEWAFSRADLENLLRTAVDEHERSSDKVRLEQCYDATTGKYLTLRQWVEQFLNTRERRGGSLKMLFKTGE